MYCVKQPKLTQFLVHFPRISKVVLNKVMLHYYYLMQVDTPSAKGNT
jgi:hypothetical protein